MSLQLLLTCATLLAVEPAFYLFANHRASDLAALVGRFGDPVRSIRRAFYGFKLLQLSVFAFWLLHFGDGALFGDGVHVGGAIAGALLVVAGQTLNAAVFLRLGTTAMFYGARYGHGTRWVRGFPYNVMRHPQFVGVVLSIWGLFLVVRFPEPDWFALPLLETVYYSLGAVLETPPRRARRRAQRVVLDEARALEEA